MWRSEDKVPERVWTRNEGLPDNQVHAPLQSHDGLLDDNVWVVCPESHERVWIGTDLGVSLGRPERLIPQPSGSKRLAGGSPSTWRPDAERGSPLTFR